MENSWKSFILLFGFLLASACSPPLSEAEMTATQEALYSPTPTKTSTPIPTSTATPTVTLTPTATPLPVEVEVQENGSTLVRIPSYGFQFELPRGWTYDPPGSDPLSPELGSAEFVNADGSTVSFDVNIIEVFRFLETELAHQVDLLRGGFGFTIHRQGLTANPYNVRLGYVESSGEFGTAHIHEYEFFFSANRVTIMFRFGESVNAIRTAIGQIQASIQLMD